MTRSERRRLDPDPEANRDPIAEHIDPAVEESYWRSSYSSRAYIGKGARYDDYGPAYRYGYERYPQYHGRTFDEIQDEMSRDWDRVKGKSRLTWNEAKHATRDAFERVRDIVERMTPGDSDRDGK